MVITDMLGPHCIADDRSFWPFVVSRLSRPQVYKVLNEDEDGTTSRNVVMGVSSDRSHPFTARSFCVLCYAAQKSQITKHVDHLSLKKALLLWSHLAHP